MLEDIWPELAKVLAVGVLAGGVTAVAQCMAPKVVRAFRGFRVRDVDNRIERRLVAILVADVVGYSRLMSVDEEGTHFRLWAYRREIIEPKIREHRGRIVKTTGDGVLVEFGSVVDAVRCALGIQQVVAARNALVPQSQRIEFRIGVNIGDVIVAADDVYGHAVNLAARLESLAAPGGVCVSQDAWYHVAGTIEVEFVDLGELSLKNISDPAHVYAILPAA